MSWVSTEIRSVKDKPFYCQCSAGATFEPDGHGDDDDDADDDDNDDDNDDDDNDDDDDDDDNDDDGVCQGRSGRELVVV